MLLLPLFYIFYYEHLQPVHKSVKTHLPQNKVAVYYTNIIINVINIFFFYTYFHLVTFLPLFVGIYCIFIKTIIYFLVFMVNVDLGFAFFCSIWKLMCLKIWHLMFNGKKFFIINDKSLLAWYETIDACFLG